MKVCQARSSAMAFLTAGAVHAGRCALRPCRGLSAQRGVGGRLGLRASRPGPSRRVRGTLVQGATGAVSEMDSSPPSPIIAEDGTVAPDVGGSVVGVFAVLDAENQVRHVGISRDVATSLRRVLARRPDAAHKYVVERFARPSRTALEEVRARWAAAAAAAGTLDEGRLGELWERPVNVTDPLEDRVDDATRQLFDDCQGRELEKALKNACRAIQKDIEQQLKDRGLAEDLKFDPKLKGRGLLDVQSVKIGVPETI